MAKYVLVLFLNFFTLCMFCQETDSIKVGKPFKSKVAGNVPKNSLSDTVATIDMYKVVSLARDTVYIDTSLTLKNHYKVNYLRRDDFGLLQFPNEGQPYNVLDYGLKRHNPFPEFGFKAKHFAYMEASDINYYNVATPFTDLFYRSVVQQGQMLDAFITLNTSENLNFAVAYKGLRSLGNYINSLSSNGNFRFITSYNTSDKRYFLKLHITAQDFTNQENGGIVSRDEFESGNEPFTQRERINVFFRDATSVLKGNRYFFDHTFRINKTNPNSIVLHHQFTYENKFFEFTQPAISDRFGEAYTSAVRNKTRNNRMYNLLGAGYTNETLGSIEVFVEDYNYNYYYKTLILNREGGISVPNQINDRINTFGARYSYQKNNWKGNLQISNSITSQSLSNMIADLKYTVNDNTAFMFAYQKMNKLPDNNFTLYQSDYIAYNWFNDFKNEKINTLSFNADTKWLSAGVTYTTFNDHLYFSDDYNPADGEDNLNRLLVSPKQYSGTINYLSVKLNREFKFRKFGFDNTVLFQKSSQDDNIINIPELVTRNTLYYTNSFFKKALYLQTGVTFQYFTDYYADDYNPLIGEFYVQDKMKIGNFPLIDFFVNAKIKQFRIFLKAEHLNSGFTGYQFYSAPNYPYRDFTFRFGIIWDFFS